MGVIVKESVDMPIEYKPYWLSVSECAVLAGECKRELDGVVKKANGRTRVKRWGWDYLDLERWLGEIPEKFRLIPFDSLTLNEYEEGRFIGPHIDSMGYGDRIFVVSLGGPATIVFHSEPVERLQLGNGSLLSFWGKERTSIKHSTEPSPGLRYSLVFRNKR